MDKEIQIQDQKDAFIANNKVIINISARSFKIHKADQVNIIHLKKNTKEKGVIRIKKLKTIAVDPQAKVLFRRKVKEKESNLLHQALLLKVLFERISPVHFQIHPVDQTQTHPQVKEKPKNKRSKKKENIKK